MECVVDLVDNNGIAPHRAALAGSSPEALAQGIPGLFRMIQNLCLEEVDPRHRRLRLSNAALRERILHPLPGALDMLHFLGYSASDEEGEAWLCLDEAQWSSSLAKEEAHWLEHLIESKWTAKPWNCPACTLYNNDCATVCAVCDGPRPPWAAAPAVAKPRLTIDIGARTRAAARSHTEQRERAEVLRRATGEKQLERERILAEARSDRQRFHADQRPTPQPPCSLVAASASTLKRPLTSMLRVRLADGQVVEETFAASDTLSQVFVQLDSILAARGEPSNDYALLQSIPRRVFIREILGDNSLGHLGLTPSATLSVLRGEDRGRVQSGSVETALLTGDITGLSYEEMLDLEARVGDVKCVKEVSCASKRNACTKVHSHGDTTSTSTVRPDEERRCCICLTDFTPGCQVRALWCDHRFHLSCVDQWLAEHDDCPICRVKAP